MALILGVQKIKEKCLNIATYLTGIIDSSSKDFSDFMFTDWHKINIQIIFN